MEVPFGLLVTRGIAEIAGVQVPMVDQVLAWAQEKLGKEYLVRGRVAGPDLAESRAPQRFGIHTFEDLLQAIQGRSARWRVDRDCFGGLFSS